MQIDWHADHKWSARKKQILTTEKKENERIDFFFATAYSSIQHLLLFHSEQMKKNVIRIFYRILLLVVLTLEAESQKCFFFLRYFKHIIRMTYCRVVLLESTHANRFNFSRHNKHDIIFTYAGYLRGMTTNKIIVIKLIFRCRLNSHRKIKIVFINSPLLVERALVVMIKFSFELIYWINHVEGRHHWLKCNLQNKTTNWQ